MAGAVTLTTGELFKSHSTAPNGSTALHNLLTLCQEGGCGEYGLIPITDIECDLISNAMGANLNTMMLNCDIISNTIEANLNNNEFQADLNNIRLECDLCQ